MTDQYGKRASAKAERTTIPAAIATLPTWLPYILFVVAAIVFFHSQIFGDTFFWEDFVEYVYPTQTFAANHLSRGVLPFWNPYTFNGMPFLADAQVGFFYPGNMLLALFTHDNHLPVLALECMIILHFVIGQAGMYKLARYWGISTTGGLIAGIAYGFSSMFVCHAFHPMMLYHLAWLPFILLHFDKGLTKASLKNALISGLIFGLVMLAGHPQSTLYIAFLLLLHAIWHVVYKLISRTANARDIFSAVLPAALPIAIAAGLFMVQYLPSRELAALSERSEFTYERATEGSLQMQQLMTAVVPHLYGQSTVADLSVPFHLEMSEYFYYWETAFYFGIATLVLGLIGAVVMARSRVGGFLLFIAVVGLLFALGSNGFLYDLFYYLPLFGSFRLPSRMLFYVVLAFALFAGFGFDALAQRAQDVSLRLILIALAIPLLISFGVVTGIIPGIVGTPEDLFSAVTSFGIPALVFTVCTALVVFAVRYNLLKALPAGLLFATVIFIDLYMSGVAFNQSPRDPEEVYHIDPAIKQMMTATTLDSLARTKMRDGSYMAVARNQGLMDNVMLYEGYNPLSLARRVPPTASPETSLDLLNVRFDIALDEATGAAGFVERPTWYPRARMLYRAMVTTPEKAADVMKKELVDFSNAVLLEKVLPMPLPDKGPTEVQHSVHCKSYTDNAFSYEVSTAENGILVLSEIWYPDWQVTIDGKPAELLRTNYSLRGVAVPAGRHVVAMEYHSAAFATGSMISLATLLLASGGAAWLQLRDTKKKQAAA